MAKQPIRSSGCRAADRRARAESPILQNVRQAAETTLSQAKQAVGQYMREATRLSGAVEASAEAAQSGARPEEIARAVVFLGSEEGGFITGSTLSINGGQYVMKGAAL